LEEEVKKKKGLPKALKIVLGVVLGIIILNVVAFFIYVSIYYKADTAALSAINNPAPGVTVEKNEYGYTFSCENPKAGIVFYPGGKVECEAYAPLMSALCQRGYQCVLLDVRFRLAFFDIDAADGIRDKYPEIIRWYLGGHSLGGVAAAEYLEENYPDYEGIILLAAYSVKDLKDKDIKALSIYGSEDRVLSMKQYEKWRGVLPGELKEVVIEGGCHSYFGSYGLQRGDGNPSISCEEQTAITAEEIDLFIEGK